jgi:glycosyltransferase involved in cell wall biosynthesis
VKWRGFVTGSAKQDLLTNGDVFLQLSECHENAPLSLIEAKRYGLYLIGSRIGGIPEIIDSAEAGMLLQPGNASALFAILRDLRDTRKALRANRATRVKGAGAYGRLEMAQQYAGAFRSLLDTNGSRLAVRRASAL